MTFNYSNINNNLHNVYTTRMLKTWLMSKKCPLMNQVITTMYLDYSNYFALLIFICVLICEVLQDDVIGVSHKFIRSNHLINLTIEKGLIGSHNYVHHLETWGKYFQWSILISYGIPQFYLFSLVLIYIKT